MLPGRAATRIVRSGSGPKVDEALFGDTRAQAARKSKIAAPLAAPPSPPAGHGHANVSAAALRKATEPVVMAASDLHAIATQTMSREQQDTLRLRDAHMREEQQQSVAEARKAKIRALEQQRLAQVPKTVLEMEEEAERARLVRYAERQRDEELDDVKAMNSMQDYAVTVTIRNRQLQEKKDRAAAEKQAERVLDIETEVARLEQVARVHEREAALRAESERLAADVRRQMEERLAEKQRQLEDLKRQASAAVEEMRLAEAAEAAKAEAERLRKAEMLSEVLIANTQSIESKKAARAADLAEWRKAQEAQAAIDARKAALEDEKERARKERDAMLTRMRGDVGKVNDDRAAQDELRARRAFEAGQRAERQRALDRARKEAEALEELRKARLAQLEDRQRRLAEEIEVDKAEYSRAMAVQRQWVESERAATDALRSANRDHVAALLRQKEEAEAAKKAEFEARRVEGARDRAAQEANLERLRKIREQKVQELLQLGVEPAYTVQLQKYDPMAAITRDYTRGVPAGVRNSKGSAGVSSATKSAGDSKK